ncbi:hypothetical protein MMC07_003310 [Pseudocyphellaria aurata]|nr:hypothetical protein [Pseudocyphellaria aurata]
MADTSPPRPQSLRFGSRSFLPLSEDVVSTRGQKLSSIIRQRSTASIGDLRSQMAQRRQSTCINDRDDEQDVERDGDRQSRDRGGNDPRELQRRMSNAPQVFMTPQMRSMRLIGKNNSRYEWEKYYTRDEELKKMKKPIREYYKHNNFLISSYLYIDRLLDSSLPHSLIQEYNQLNIPQTISEERAMSPSDVGENSVDVPDERLKNDYASKSKVKRTPKALYKVPDENAPLLGARAEDGPKAYEFEQPDGSGEESGSRVVIIAIYINLAANTILLAGKIAVIVLTSSLSVLASLVDAALDFLSTAIVWTTTKLISRNDQYSYPVGRRRLEPLGVLVFSVIMITSFFQVSLQCFERLTSTDHSIVHLGLPSILILASTVLVKFFCWLWCRLIKNSSVQALAQDAMTDVVFNTFSIIFPLIGYYLSIWWLDALGGLLLSLYVIFNWSRTTTTHIQHLTGAAAPAADRNILLYLTMRFARTIQKIQGLQAYHAGDKLNVEVDIVLDESMTLRDSHDLGESLQYVLESVPNVDRAFVHLDYAGWNLPSHMEQQEE